MCYKNKLFDKNVIDKNESYILFYTFPTYQVGMTNVFQTQGYLSISLGWRFETFWRFFSQKTKSFQKIITFTIFMKNGGSTVASKNQALNWDCAKKLTKKDTNLIFLSSESWDVAFFNSDVGWTPGWTPGSLFYFEITSQFCEKL